MCFLSLPCTYFSLLYSGLVQSTHIAYLRSVMTFWIYPIWHLYQWTPHKLNMHWKAFLAFLPYASQMLEQVDPLSMHPLPPSPSGTASKLLSCLPPVARWNVCAYQYDVMLFDYIGVCKIPPKQESSALPTAKSTLKFAFRRTAKEIILSFISYTSFETQWYR